MGIRSFFTGKKKNKSGRPTADPHIQEWERVFKKFDANGDGKISSLELGSVMKSLGIPATEEELRKMVHEADSDGDGFIDLGEFIEINTKGLDSSALLADIRSAFHVFDRDGNGWISAEDLYAVMQSLGDKSSMSQCKKMIIGVDSDGDGKVSFENFLIMMTRSLPAVSSPSS